MNDLVKSIKNASVPKRPIKIYAIETAVTDIHYAGGNEELKKDYFARLPQLLGLINAPSMDEAPRPGDMRMIDAKDFERTIRAFFQQQGIGEDSSIETLKHSLFGTPTMHAGGSLANTFDAMVNSTIDGQPIFEGIFQTAVGGDEAGKTFIESLRGHEAIISSDDHVTMTCHVIPTDGDRILITTPNGDKASQNLVSADIVKDALVVDKIMIGGFVNFTPNGFGIYDRLANMMSKSSNNPEFILTAANQGVVEMRHVQQQIRKTQRAFNTTIHANTGEFRRLLGMDDHWRHRTEGRFDRLSGHALEDAKKADSEYQMDKDLANLNAIEHALRTTDRYTLNHYIVTNGSNSTYKITSEGKERIKTPKLDRSQIVSTVGAGDNHMAGYQIGMALFGGCDKQAALNLANKFAAAVIKTPLARLDKNAEITIAGRKLRGPLAHALS